MLVLSRKVDEVLVAGPVVIRVLKVQGGRVSLGLIAPPEVRILRAELCEGDEPKAIRVFTHEEIHAS